MDNKNEEVKSESQEVNDVPAETAGSTEAAQSEETVATEEQGNVPGADLEESVETVDNSRGHLGAELANKSEISVNIEVVEETDAAAAGDGEE